MMSGNSPEVDGRSDVRRCDLVMEWRGSAAPNTSRGVRLPAVGASGVYPHVDTPLLVVQCDHLGERDRNQKGGC